MSAPRGLPDQVWLVMWPDGQRHFVTKELLGGAAEWAKGTSATVVRYRLEEIVYTPPPKTKKSPA